MYSHTKFDDFIFEQIIGGLDKSMQATMRMFYARNKILDRENRRKEREQLKQEVGDYVLSKLSATVDVQEIIDQIEELRRAIDSLGK